MADENGCPFGEHSREIRLADVLLAIEEHYRFSSNPALEIDAILKLTTDTYDNGVLVHERLWNPHDDNLDHQSKETKQFLIDLLVTQ
jgi:hypothetical protein